MMYLSNYMKHFEDDVIPRVSKLFALDIYALN